MGKGIIMDEYFEDLFERAQYYEQFEFFRREDQKVRVGFNRSEQFQNKITVIELTLKHKQEKND